MTFDPDEVTLFGVVSYNHATGQHELIAVQTKPVVIFSSGTATADWTVSSVTGGLPTALFQVAWDSRREGTLALNLQSDDGTPFVNNQSVTVQIDVTGAGVEDITVHLRALPGLQMLQVAGGTALLGAGSSPGQLLASGDPSSAGYSGIPAWTAIHWSDPSGTATVAAGPATGTSIDGPAGAFQLALDPSTLSDAVGALFDGASSVTLPGTGGKTVMTGPTQPEIIADGAAPTVSITGLDTEVGVSPGTPKTLTFSVGVEDTHYFPYTNVRFRFEWIKRYDGAPQTTIFEHVSGNWQRDAATVDPSSLGVTVNVPSASVDDADRAPVDPGSWGGAYTGAAENVTRAQWTDLTVQISDGTLESFRFAVEVTDLAGNTTSFADTVREVLIGIPTDIVLCLDYSGSMSRLPTGGLADPTEESKWDAARAAANRFHAVYHAIASGIGGEDVLDSQVGYVRFWWLGGDQSTASVGLTDVDAGTSPDAGTLVSDDDPAAGHLTPIADGIKKSVAELTASGSSWRRRVVLAMTDGYENRGTDVADIRTTDSSDPDYIQNTTDDAQNGIIIHSCAFGQDSGVDAEKMDWLATGSDGAKGFGGTYHSTATADTPDAARALTDQFLNILVDSLPTVNRLSSGDALDESLLIEPGVARAVILITSDQPASLRDPADVSLGEGVSAAGVRWWELEDPTEGDYSVDFVTDPAAGEVDLHGIVDLQLRASFSVDGPGTVGSTLTLRACITDGGQPVSGADVRAEASVPGRSDGELVSRYAAVSRAKRGWGALRVHGTSKLPDALSHREALVRAAEGLFGLPERHHCRQDGFRLHEKPDEPGCYEASFTDTSKEGSYGFRFEARGSMQGGHPFERAYGVSRYLSPVASPDLTGVSWLPGRIVDGKRWWTLAIEPTTASGHPVGGGRRYEARLANRKEHLTLRDRLDGTYLAELELEQGEPPPAIELIDGARRVQLRSGRSAVDTHRVRVVLTGVQVDDIQEGLCNDGGELTFDAIAAPAFDPDRVVRRRFPDDCVLKLREGERADVHAVLFDGFVEDGAPLLLALGAREHDWTKHGEHVDPLATYRRVLRGPVRQWAGSYEPGDERPDPEELCDWKLWYRVEVL